MPSVKTLKYFYTGWQAVCCPEPLNCPPSGPTSLPQDPRVKAWVSMGPPRSWLQGYGHIHSDYRVGIFFEQTPSSQILALPLISQTWEIISYLYNRDNSADLIGLL